MINNLFHQINWDLLTSIALILTLFAVIWYAYETKKLREETSKQTELNVRPLVIISCNYGYKLVNIGNGPALNISIKDIIIEINSFKITRYYFPKIAGLLPNLSIHLDIKVEGIDKIDDFHWGIINPETAKEDYKYSIYYENIINQKYITEGTIGKNGAVFKKTRKLK